jgi:small conductance mechanosensitive channel
MKSTLLFIIFISTAGLSLAEAVTPEDSSFVVIRDESLPIDEMSLLLDPFSREDLIEEVALWQDLLRSKLRTVSEVQITLKYLNKDIQQIEAIQNGMSSFLAAAKDREEGLAAAQGDTTRATADKMRELDQTLIESRFNLKNIISLALSREAKAYQGHNLEIVVRRGMESLRATGKSGEFEEFTTVELGLTNLKNKFEEKNVDFDPNDSELMDFVRSELESVLAKKAGVRDLVMEYLGNLMNDKGELAKRLRLVIREMEKKGATVEEVASLQTYVNEVTSFQLDVADSATRWSLLGLWLKSESGGIKLAWNLGKFLALMLFFTVFAFLVGLVVRKGLDRTSNVSQLMKSFIIRSIRRVVLLVGFVLSLSILGVNIAPILGMIGAAGFILAFALQSTLGNFASGIMIMVYKPFDVGDAIDAAGVMGVVNSMNLTSTIINTFDNKLVIVPNNSIWGSVITNITGSETRRVDLVFRVGYGDDTDLAEKIIHEVLAEQDMILPEPAPNVQMHELSDFTVNFICRPWVKTTDYWNVRWELTKKIRERFDRAGFAPPVDPGGFIKRLGRQP